jgi:hypothetical protein
LVLVIYDPFAEDFFDDKFIFARYRFHENPPSCHEIVFTDCYGILTLLT